MLREVVKGSANISIYAVIEDSVAFTPETGVAITDLDMQYVRNGEAPAAKANATELAATNSAHTDNAGKEIDATDQPGLYRFDFPDAAFAAGADTVTCTVKGAGFRPVDYEIALVNPRTVGYAGGAVWVDTNGSNVGTVDYVDGVADKPVSTLAAATTIAESLGIKKFHLAPGSSITLAQAYDYYTFDARGATIALGGVSINGAIFIGSIIIGSDDGSNSNHVQYIDCVISNNTLGQFVMKECYFTGTLTLAQAGDYYTFGCYSGIPGTATPSLDFGALLNASGLNMRNYSGGIHIHNMGAGDGAYNMTFEGRGQLIINANCSGGTIAIRGHVSPITDNVVGGFKASGGVIADPARFDVDQVANAVWDEMLSGHSVLGCAGRRLRDAQTAHFPNE